MPVYKDKKGKFFFKCSIHSQQFLRRGFSTREEALNAERVFIVGYKGDSVPNFSLLVSSYLAYKKLLVKSSTFIHQKEDIERHVIGHFPDIGVDRISLGDFVKFRSYVASLKIKGGNVLLNYLVSIFKYCEDVFGYKCRFVRVLVPFRDDSFGIAKMAVKEKVFSLEDFEKFLRVCDDRMYRLMFILAFITGLRLGEARGLQVKSFDGKSLSVFQIASSKLRVGKSVLTSPKSKDSFRTYVLPGFLSDMLQSYIAEGGLSGDDYLFHSSRGADFIIGETTVNRVLSDLCKRAGIPHINFHMFRHTEASFLNQEGVDDKMIADWLGHSSSEVTKKYYIHTTDGEKEKIASILDDKYKDLFR